VCAGDDSWSARDGKSGREIIAGKAAGELKGNLDGAFVAGAIAKTRLTWEDLTETGWRTIDLVTNLEQRKVQATAPRTDQAPSGKRAKLEGSGGWEEEEKKERASWSEGELDCQTAGAEGSRGRKGRRTRAAIQVV
jgi:hypothetical protein